MSYFETNKNNPLNESLHYEDMLSISFKDLLARNDHKVNQTLGELNSLMSTIQGADDKNERKAYFKAKKFHQKLVEFINEPDSEYNEKGNDDYKNNGQ